MTTVEKRRRIAFLIIALLLFHALCSEWLFDRNDLQGFSPEIQTAFTNLFDEYQLLWTAILGTE